MKKLVLVVASVLSLNFLNAQTQNDKGLYIDSEGSLFNGTIEKIQNSIKTDYTVKDGIVNGEATYYYASGNKMETGTFTNGQKDQKWIRFNENGTIAAIAFYSLGKKTGTWLVYDENGKKRFEMNYDNGSKTGIWTNWDENGAVASTKDYSHVN
ncbi:MAG: toxin-antitoxin system YwqK family antitoxin [Bacteroidota bacterium]